MAKDPTGYETALATIPKGQLSERQQRIAVGLAMIREGSTIAEASRHTMIPWSTLDRYNRGISKLGIDSGPGDARRQEIVDTSYDMTMQAGQAVLESLRDERDQWKPNDLVKAYSAGADRFASLSRQEAPTDTGVSALTQLLEKGDVTISKRKPDAEAIEVEASEEQGD